MPELLDYRVNIHIHDNIVTIMQLLRCKNKNIQIYDCRSNEIFRTLCENLFVLNSIHVGPIDFEWKKVSIGEKKEEEEKKRKLVNIARDRPFAEQSGKLKRAVGCRNIIFL